ncbi:hypothetical protein MADA3029_620019 [Vibrio nigripulchritudo MADA3029]|uniref:hypothetical protein n=1 Tax=Vibrio nigripulchritudo TaxID=28173 RepID=UPI0003B19B62|nr:hypothetical protein [Vibrio nigripulchritudo]CCN45259.1 hypothetical protein VIBNIMADA3020_1020018 [Vibrio nigripulchritudo MADA3020]CCN53073.1 hypothetical protein VIBNIMADA3021_180019 [Vibrio nigripulchritudo MADA3021]CCN60665.1 hypothetical protein MADA3029_620019 [Vibrio nigripulchritudo MADA3029]
MSSLDWPWVVIIISLLLLIINVLNGYVKAPISNLKASALPSIMPIVVSVAVLGSALYVVLSGGYAEAEQKWAFGAIGTILGYWLKK